MQISTSLGNLSLEISGKAKDGQAAARDNIAAASLVYRAGGSKLFGKKSGHERSEAFGEKLAKDATAAIQAVLAPYFDGIKVEASKYEPKVSAASEAQQKSHDALKALGVEEAALRQAFPNLYNGAVEAAPKTGEISVG